MTAFRMFWLDWQYHSVARKTDGTVLKKWKSAGSSISYGSTGTSRSFGAKGAGVNVSLGSNYTIRYQYRTALGVMREDEDDVSRSDWERVQPGDVLSVFYLPKLPHHSRLSTGMRPLLPLTLFLLGAPMTFLGTLGEFFIVGDLRKKYLNKHQTNSTNRHPSAAKS